MSVLTTRLERCEPRAVVCICDFPDGAPHKPHHKDDRLVEDETVDVEPWPEDT